MNGETLADFARRIKATSEEINAIEYGKLLLAAQAAKIVRIARQITGCHSPFGVGAGRFREFWAVNGLAIGAGSDIFGVLAGKLPAGCPSCRRMPELPQDTLSGSPG